MQRFIWLHPEYFVCEIFGYNTFSECVTQFLYLVYNAQDSVVCPLDHVGCLTSEFTLPVPDFFLSSFS